MDRKFLISCLAVFLFHSTSVIAIEQTFTNIRHPNEDQLKATKYPGVTTILLLERGSYDPTTMKEFCKIKFGPYGKFVRGEDTNEWYGWSTDGKEYRIGATLSGAEQCGYNLPKGSIAWCLTVKSVTCDSGRPPSPKLKDFKEDRTKDLYIVPKNIPAK